MKALKLIAFAGLATLGYTSCQTADARYVDLETGDTIMVEKDSETGAMINKETRKPVRLYVNTSNNDTIFGTTGEVVNSRIRVSNDAYYVFSGDQEYKIDVERDGDYKVKIGEDGYKLKVDEDGTYKEKYGDDYKIKRTKDEIKIKRGDDYKKEIEKDGDVTIKDGNVKIKIDGETGERKVKVDD